MAGAIVAARIQKVPVLLDGYGALAAGAAVVALREDALDHCQVADASAAPGAAHLAARLGKTPLLALGLSRPEGLAGVAALGVMRAAASLFRDG
jgi:nicotinate-nucleotide--dimethylbenzimidazole phosphoribosyltransferase